MEDITLHIGTRRVKTIYSVIASSNRLEILRILNTKGPLSYSELKTLAGFKSKKESGKFAYHLRKLVRQMLINLSRSERKYSVTSLGRLILNLTRQIEEQSVIESGKLFVRTSRQTMEEFNVDKITQSLVKEAGMPVELAQKITSEVESRLYKFQTTYLTSPLIREIVNSVLIEHGYDEYRHRLTRLGLPVYDVNELIAKIGSSGDGIDSLLSQTFEAVLSEFLFLNQLPKDVSDLHLSGDIHISNSGRWGLVPDTLFIDLTHLKNSGLHLAGSLFPIPRISPPKDLADATTAFTTLASLMASESSAEICCRGFNGYVASSIGNLSDEEALRTLKQGFILSSLSLPHKKTSPFVSIQIGGTLDKEFDCDQKSLDRSTRLILEAYKEYSSITPLPKLKLILNDNIIGKNELADNLLSIVNVGGAISLCQNDSFYSYLGLRGDSIDSQSFNGVILHGLSLNLARMAHESIGDETYLRAKLALLLRSSKNALVARKKIVAETIKKGLMPALASNSAIVSAENVKLVVNLTALPEAINSISGERSSLSNYLSTSEKILDTANKVASEKEEQVTVAMIPEYGTERLAVLDTEKYGKSAVGPQVKHGYSQSINIKIDNVKDDLLRKAELFSSKLNGGCSVRLQLSKQSSADDILNVINKLKGKINSYTITRDMYICRNCGSKTSSPISRCKICKSATIQQSPFL